jgi:hypothetical protein
MATTLVLNTATGAVTEYTWSFQSLTDALAASPAGLFTLGGDTDAGAPIVGEFRAGTPGGGPVQNVAKVYVGMDSPADGVLIVQGRNEAWEYPLQRRDSGVPAARPGRGIRESYLGFGFRNTAGAAFRIDSIEADVIPLTPRRK